MSTSETRYHHGDLRAALLSAAAASLDSGEPFSLRAVARRAGVSPAAPYRHFVDRDALESALAVDGFDGLRGDLVTALAAVPAAASAQDVTAAMGIAYVDFALRRPAVFRLMFGKECDPDDDERVRASGAIHDTLAQAIRERFAWAPAELATALWSVAHGLAFLHLDGKLRPASAADVQVRVRASVDALFQLGAPGPLASDGVPA